jgi:hypothetical protein
MMAQVWAEEMNDPRSEIGEIAFRGDLGSNLNY